MKRFAVLMVLLGLALTICLASFAADAKKGSEIYAKNGCKTCHAIAGAGNPKHPLDGVGASLTAELLAKWIRTPKEMNPKATMTSFPIAKIADTDLADLVAYLLTLKKP